MRSVHLFLGIVAMFHGLAFAAPVAVTSPDGKVVVSVDVRDGRPVYDVKWQGEAVVLESPLGMTLDGGVAYDRDFALGAVERSEHDSTWKTVVGERAQVRDHYRQATIELAHSGKGPARMQLVVRAYDEGAAFRYIVPEQAGFEQITIKSELTHFAFADGAMGWAVPHAQGVYQRVAVGQLAKSSDRPLTVELPGGKFAAVGEAAMIDHARMYLSSSKQLPGALVSTLHSPVTAKLPMTSPWRFIMVANKPGELLERNYLLLNLNEPCKIADTSWIKPGKVIREVTLSTTGGKACVDFAVARNLQYIEFDAGWYGHEYDDASDATTVTVDPKRNPKGDLDLPAVLEYAKSKNIGVILYVNRRALEKQLDVILPLYQKWGIKGLKYGFVNVGSQQWSTWLHEAIAKAAAHQMVIDVHDEYRTTGNERTWPNLLTVEGIRGNEEMPGAAHNTILPFTRYLAGPGDYTICYYSAANRMKTTHGHQLALAVVYYSPMQFVYWYDRPANYQGEPEIEFFDRVPTVWDETRVIDGAIGQFITTARRSGDDWFVGTITGDEARTVQIPLTFLPAGKTYSASIYEDGGEEIATRTKVAIRRVTVTRDSVITANLKATGGQAIWLKPAKTD